MIDWMDAHAHWAQHFPGGSDENQLRKRIQDLQKLGMSLSLQGGVGPEDWQRQLELAQFFPGWFRPVLGLHPWWINEHSQEECDGAFRLLGELVEQNRSHVAGMGELGLDFSKGRERSFERQLHFFQLQLELARRISFPLVIHTVHAHEEALEVLLDGAHQKPIRGIIHAFSGSFELAQRYLALGLKLSLGPGLAEPGRFLALKRALPRLPPESWVLESDGAGERFFRTAQAAAGITGRSLAEIAQQTAENLKETGLIR